MPKAWVPSWCGNMFRGGSHSLERTLLVLFIVVTAPDQRFASPDCLLFYRGVCQLKLRSYLLALAALIKSRPRLLGRIPDLAFTFVMLNTVALSHYFIL